MNLALRWLITAVVLTPMFAAADLTPPGWQASATVIAEHEAQKPQSNWREESVPPYELPDPLQTADGRVIESAAQWQQHRAHLLELFRQEIYGRRPGAPDNLEFELLEENASAMNGAATLRRIAIQSTVEDRTHQFVLTMFLPNQADGPVPVFLLMNNRGAEIADATRQARSEFWPAEAVIRRGYAIAAIQNGDLAPDDSATYREGIIRLFEGEAADGERAADAGTAIAAWSWGASRVMDYLETDPRVNAQRVAVVGHSRGGKAALWTGAEDERFALVISNESGCAGAALSRRRFGETVRDVNRFTWFAANFRNYMDREHALPIDQHQLLALIAPRALYVASADEDLWADPRGEFLSLAHASPVYALWGHPPIDAHAMPPLNQPIQSGPRGYHIRDGGHDLTLADWESFLNFADHLWN